MSRGYPDYSDVGGQPPSIKHINGTVAAAGATITFGTGIYSVYLWIQNNSWDNLEVSFDSGVTYILVGKMTGFEIECNLSSIIIRSAHATRSVSYNILVLYR